LGLLRNPTEFFVRQRERHGDTFIVDAFGHRLFCVFSPDGVRSLYAQPEEQASFGMATYTLIKAKVPIELLLGRRNHPKSLFGNAKVETYMDNLHQAVGQEIDRLGDTGKFEIFDEMRRLGHRLGLASWSGPEAASPRYIERLIPLFDRLDSSESFVRPDRNVVTWATRKRSERRAMKGIEEILGEIIASRAGQPPVGDFLDQIYQSYADLPPDEQMTGTARDVIVIHMGSQSNLYAALAWTFVNLLHIPTCSNACAKATTCCWIGAPTNPSEWPNDPSPCVKCSNLLRSTPEAARIRWSPDSAHHHVVGHQYLSRSRPRNV